MNTTDLATITQAVSVLAACWAIISGIGAWKREFIGKRRIELAEQTLAKFYEIRDAISFIRNPFSHKDEGSSRLRSDRETSEQTEWLNRGYIVVERYALKEDIFAEFNSLKYRFMSSFGSQTGEIFVATSRASNSIFVSARILAIHYWQREGRGSMGLDESHRHLEEMNKHESILWDAGDENDEILTELAKIQAQLEAVVMPCFQEPTSIIAVFTKKLRQYLTSHFSKFLRRFAKAT